MSEIDADVVAKVAAVVEQLAKGLPETLARVKDVVATVSDNKLKLKLAVIENNLKIYESQIALAQTLLASHADLGIELIRGISTMADRLVEINYALAEVVGSQTREQNSRRWTETLTDAIRKHPELLALPFAPWLAAGTFTARSLLEAPKEPNDKPDS